jgi:hypothetical protein
MRRHTHNPQTPNVKRARHSGAMAWILKSQALKNRWRTDRKRLGRLWNREK